jgi:thiol:disulfide interchange protein DsbD
LARYRIASLLLPALAVLCFASGEAKVKPPVEWRIKAAPTKPIKPGGKFTVTIAGQIDPGWHLYALEEPQGGPVATEIALAEDDPADLLHVDEGKPKVLPDPLFDKPTGYFESAAEFTLHLQAPKTAAPGGRSLHVLVRYQSCNDKVCLPPHTDAIEVPLP